MMISSSLPLSNAAPASEGRITQAKDVQGFSQRNASGQTPLNQSAALSEQAVPSFRLAAQTFSSEERKEATTATTEENATVDTTGMNVLLSATTPTETSDLAAQAQTLTQGMLNMAEKSVASFNKVNPLEVKGEAKTTSPAQANALLNISPQQQDIQTTSANARVNTSAVDFQVLLNQPAQGQATTAPLNVQTSAPSAQAVSAATVAHAHTQGSEWAAVKVDTSAGKWGEQMMQVLHDRVTLQAQQSVQEAKIRLDPPDLGKLDLLVRVEGDRLSVQINANTAATREALMQVSERLRTELQEQNFVHVDVNVGADQGQERHQQQMNDEDTTIFAARESSAFQSNTTNYSEHWLNTQA
ncbi:flagellar hook-length control protein FliK [Vibrio parahaemolyticus]|uniref:flagellar hook-length control protein FliK n=1 Tax=Vibrio parahaemolyticus TaxID=670 RepID=UPI00084AC5D3|nr:flagellar hook-length control protein FliK [Vibrio parahaemolyticus]ODX27457.1 flagellar hook-length control protein FliK [Vibrio parahaemolyticus]